MSGGGMGGGYPRWGGSATPMASGNAWDPATRSNRPLGGSGPAPTMYDVGGGASSYVPNENAPAIGSPPSAFGKGVMPTYQGPGVRPETGGMTPRDTFQPWGGSAMPFQSGGASPAPMQQQFQNFQQQSPQAAMLANSNNVAGFNLGGAAPGANMRQPFQSPGINPQQPSPYTVSAKRADGSTNMDPLAGMNPYSYGAPNNPIKNPPPMPTGPNQPGQHGYYWGPGHLADRDSSFGWNEQWGPAAKQYIVGQLAGGTAPWASQVNWGDALNSIGRLSGTPFNPSIYGGL